MAIFRGTGGSVSSSDSTIVDAVTAQATIATTKAGEASTSATTATTKASEASTSATTATTKASEANTSATTASTKATEATTAKTGAETAQTAAEAARDAALGHSNTANSSAVQTVAGSNTQVVGVYNNIANVNTVAGVNTDVTTVAGISSDVTTVAADASDIGTVSTNIANVNNVGNNIANVNAVHGNASNINTVAADGTDIGTVATNIANVNTVAGISSNVTTVAGLESKMDTVIADASDIGAVAGNIGDVTTVAGINSDVDTVAGIAAKVTTVADNITDVQAADTNATNAATSASDASASATSASNSATTATTKATEASNSATAASNSATTATTKASQAAGSATTAGTSASTATTKASEASASATTATTKAGEAASSASAASGSASTATTKAAEADASATSAATSATNSSNAASTWNDFYTTYLGAADAPPTVDVQGNALQTGAFYYDTGAGSNTVGLYVYNGSTWVYSTNYNNVTAPYILSQDLNANGNDIISAGNVGIGTASPDDVGSSKTLHINDNTHGGAIRLSEGGTNNAFISYDHPTGMRIQSIDTIALKTANAERMRITSSGNVGIGTTSPSRKLVIQDTGAQMSLLSSNIGSSVLNLGDTDDDNIGRIQYDNNHDKMAFRTNTVDRLTIDSSGKVGIGTSSPDSSIVVKSSGTNNQSLLKLNTDSGTRAFIGSDAQDDGYLYLYDGSDNLKTAFRTDGNDSYIAGGGNVGIGTSSPTTRLDVRGGVNNAHATFTGQASRGLVISTANTLSNDDGVVYNAQTASSGKHIFQTAGAERMRIDSSGNVGIGSTNPQDLLHINSDTTDARILLDGHTNFDAELKFAENGSIKYTVGHDAATDSFRIGTTNVDTNPRLVIDSSGNVLVGTTSVSNSGKVTIDAGANATGLYAVTDATAGYAASVFERSASDGDITVFKKGGSTVGSISVTSSATAYNTSSDERLKENITDSADAGSKIDAIQVRQFDWKADGSHQDYGVVAQELLEVAPEAVSEGETEDDMMSVDYSKLVPTLIKEIQTLRNRVAQLENN